MIMLKAPGFFTVKQWRHEQELRLKEKLIAQGAPTNQLMDEASIERFIQHYERITSHSLETIPEFANDVFELDENRMIHNHIERGDS
jgi:D-glycerate 3-kinase